MQEPQHQYSDHDKIIQISEWRKGHDEKIHPDIAIEIRELRATINKVLLAIVGLMITIGAAAVGVLSSIGD